MEAKVIIYIVGGILYFLYTVGKKIQDGKKPAPGTGKPAPQQKPVSPPVSKPLKQVMQDVKRMQQQQEVKKRLAETPKQVQPTKLQKKDLIGELEKRGRLEVEAEKQTSPAMRAAEINEMDLLHADSYKQKAEENEAYEIDAKQAFIGSIIFERKF